MKANIETKDGTLVCECGSSLEALKCLAQLIKIDKLDNTYEKGFYKIVYYD